MLFSPAFRVLFFPRSSLYGRLYLFFECGRNTVAYLLLFFQQVGVWARNGPRKRLYKVVVEYADLTADLSRPILRRNLLFYSTILCVYVWRKHRRKWPTFECRSSRFIRTGGSLLRTLYVSTSISNVLLWICKKKTYVFSLEQHASPGVFSCSHPNSDISFIILRQILVESTIESRILCTVRVGVKWRLSLRALWKVRALFGEHTSKIWIEL